MVVRVPVNTSRQQHHTLLFDQFGRETICGNVRQEARKAYAAHPRANPLYSSPPLLEEGVGVGKVVQNEAQVPVEDLVFGP